ncbi:MAG: hypothetical protein K2N37_02205 [Lachnospiraceae bacterium]|nr:hypothetical protein [Lachnospiraceae bacterium]
MLRRERRIRRKATTTLTARTNRAMITPAAGKTAVIQAIRMAETTAVVLAMQTTLKPLT